jgi:chromosome segregation protein
MLKAIELSGFKSFADRTRFEFPAGICVVVGPNGSGKSNIVDAVKWVLGAQSAKSLRGKEMTDVIFNGCASRAAQGTAEVTLTLDNSAGRLPIEAKEVHVARRVYRSGEGEYLLNRQPCRLRDIRDLLANTGITTEAYCIIEQGKVDALLQSSPRDRRVIFEEAAGISQFKSKKASALRRMERVEQNLLRLKDIVDEVESRVRSVRAQASKARRYRECAERLQQLRTEVALVDWRTLTRQLSARDSQLADLKLRTDACGDALTRSEADATELEDQVEASATRSRGLEAAVSATREQIAARQANVDNQQARHLELAQEISRVREKLAAMSGSSESLFEQFRDAAVRLREAETEFAAADELRRQHTERALGSQRELDAARAACEQLRNNAERANQRNAVLATKLTELHAQVPSAISRGETLLKHLAELSQRQRNAIAQLQIRERAERELLSAVEAHQAALNSAEARRSQARRELARVDGHQRQLEARLTRTRERIVVLSELEQRLEGLDTGVQEALRLARESPDGPFSEVHGVVADLFHVDVDTAPLVEMALGERTQFAVVATTDHLLERLQHQPLGVAGRVGFLSLDVRAPMTALDHVDLSAEPGVMGRADRFVETATEYQPLVRRLLGRTWLVDRMATALRLAQGAGRGLDFVTSDGERLDADGTLIIGPRHAATGILSRRSELRACHDQVGELERQLTHQVSMHARLEKELAKQESLVASSVVAYTAATGKLAEMTQQTASWRSQTDRIADEAERTERDLQATRQNVEAIRAEIASLAGEKISVEKTGRQLVSQLHAAEQSVTAMRVEYERLQASVTECQIVTAKSEQRLELYRHQFAQAERNRLERARATTETRQQLALREQQTEELDQAMLAGRQALAELFASKERQLRELADQQREDEVLRERRGLLGEGIRSLRQQLTSLLSQQHKLEVAATRIRHERQTLCARMKDDYGISLEAAASEERVVKNEEIAAADSLASQAAPRVKLNREAVEQEIAGLREQLTSLGAINLEALDELEQLEARFEKLSGQYGDLMEAKATLERIIARINGDSRSLFQATLESVRGHFQELFRRMFGGGEADIVIDEADDVLECGIEIVARPPGKEACSISLLSGGEKTLTCVALLLAVFRSKPSPFCVLDEVDAALDEANIGRFIGVLQEFLSFTQFVVVTHSKKTMAGADTLYGVTMEESGVSKRVSVRFEDVSEDGQILPSALLKSAERGAADEEMAARRAA